jgi:hypothetical protein
MARAVTAPLPAEVAALFSTVRARLRRHQLVRVVERVAWLVLSIEAIAVATHLGVTVLSPLLVPLLVLVGVSLALAAMALYRPRAEDCARYADSKLDGRSAYGATLAASTGRLSGSPAALDWLIARTRAAAPAAEASLARAAPIPWPTASLVAAGTGAVAVALILSLPGGSPGSAPQIAHTQGTTTQAPARQAREQPADTKGAQHSSAAEPLGRAATHRAGTPPLAASNEPASATRGAESGGAGAAGGREAGSSADESTRAAMGQILELRVRRRTLETGGGIGGAGSAAYSAEPASIADTQPVVAPAASPSARVRPELAGPVQTRLLDRYAALREAGQ